VGVFTTLPRDEWGSHRVHLSNSHADNKRILRVIDRAILVLCLDHLAPSSLKEDVQTALCGLPLPNNIDTSDSGKLEWSYIYLGMFQPTSISLIKFLARKSNSHFRHLKIN
jgi:hypothetical protein